MSRRFIYIINPVSGTRIQNNLQQFLEEKTTQKGIPFSIYPSVANGDYSFLHQKIKEEKITDIIIAGGDGTVSQVVGNLMDFDVNFGIIPCGSGNGLAFAAKISRQRAKTLDTIFAGKASLIDGFMVNGRFACMLCGLGFDARVAHDFVNQSQRGLVTYVRLALKNFFSVRPYLFEIQLSNTNLETDAYFISVANSNQFGNNFTIAPKACLSDGLLDVVIITGHSKVSFVIQTLQQFAGWNKLQAIPVIKQKSSAIYFQTDRVRIINKSLAPFHVDGEPAETPKTLDIEIKRKCFRLLHPL